MSAVLEPQGLAGQDHSHDHDHPHGWRRWVYATNHKDIGTLYLWFSFTMFLFGGVLALGIRVELFQPGIQLIQPELFNQLTTMHGLIMVFGAIMPAFVGFANWMVPPANWRLRYGLCTHEQLQFLADGSCGPSFGGLLLCSRRCCCSRMDTLCAPDASNGCWHGHGHLRPSYSGRLLHHGLH